VVSPPRYYAVPVAFGFILSLRHCALNLFEETIAIKMYINGKWVAKDQTAPVFNPYDQSVVDTVPRANAADVDLAITSAIRGAKAMGAMPAYQR
jgi:delta 1-pyrroline-5-carboxylate dehydrogenase